MKVGCATSALDDLQRGHGARGQPAKPHDTPQFPKRNRMRSATA
jgi:hypothetical protein